jgi:predicted MFS family arabinose efflux permease
MILPFALDRTNFVLIAFIVFYGLDWVATVPPTVRLTQDAFGPVWGTVAYGWIFSAHQLGAAMAAWLAGYMREINGDYFLAFTSAGWLSLAASMMAIRIGRTRLKRRPIGEAMPSVASA